MTDLLRSTFFAALSVAAITLLAVPADLRAEDTRPESKVSFSIRAQALSTALIEFANQADIQVLTAGSEVEGATAGDVAGRLTLNAALERMLEGSGFTFRFVDAKTLILVKAGQPAKTTAAGPSKMWLARAEAMPTASSSPDSTDAADAERTAAKSKSASDKGIPEILVRESRSSNVDIRRTEDDVQPYVVFEAEEIESSMAQDLETFLKTRLPMNQLEESQGQISSGIRGNQSVIDLRGLGADQTLVLVNGRRMPEVANNINFYQPDINGIPLSAVERIEILPSTAGGIYGGGATGGVVNIILKRDYNNLQVKAVYDGTFQGGGSRRRLEATGGFTLEEGKTQVMITASQRQSRPLYAGDREFNVRGRALMKQNDPDEFDGPPFGYTTNIRSDSGNDLELVSGQSLNSPYASVPVGYAGPASDGGAAFLNSAAYNLDIPNDVNGLRRSLVSVADVRSAALNVRREFTPRIEAFVDTSYYDNDGVSSSQRPLIVTLDPGPNNPFTEEVELSIPFAGISSSSTGSGSRSQTTQVAGGIIARLPWAWTAHAEYVWSKSERHRWYSPDQLTGEAFDALADGRLDPLRDVNAAPLDLSPYYFMPDTNTDDGIFNTFQKTATLRLAGPLWELPGGPINLSMLLENRESNNDDTVVTKFPLNGTGPEHRYYGPVGSTVDSIYGEVTIPLVSAHNARRWVQGLDFQASHRYDATETRARPLSQSSQIVDSPNGPFPDIPFQTNNVSANQTTFGFRFQPTSALALRLSYGEGVLPPNTVQLTAADLPTIFALLLRYTDPKRGDQLIYPTLTSFTYIGSFDLRAEQSQSWSGGMILTPDALPGFRLSVDYTRIKKKDEITNLSQTEYQYFIDHEDDLFPNRITRGMLTPADEALGYTVGPITGLDGGPLNLTHSLVEAFDIQADYTWDTSYGAFTANVMGTYQPHLKQQLAQDAPVVDRTGYRGGPLEWRGNVGLNWKRGAWTAGWNMQYYDAHFVYGVLDSESTRDRKELQQGAQTIPNQTYHDLFGRYRFGESSASWMRLLSNTEILVSVRNVFDDLPPILATTSAGSGGYSTYGDAHLRSYSISLTKTFSPEPGYHATARSRTGSSRANITRNARQRGHFFALAAERYNAV